MGKSRLADAFGQTCPMINFVLHETEDGYPPRDDEILSFTRKQLSEAGYRKIFGSPLKKKPMPEHPAAIEFSKRRVAIIWSHCLAVRLLWASLQKCELSALLHVCTNINVSQYLD